LIDSGYKNIAFLGTASDHCPELLARYQGYHAALMAAGFKPDSALQVDALTTEAEGQAAMKTLLSRGVTIDAVFAASDMIAIGAMAACRDTGLNVPQDIAVVGFDDIPAAAFANPPLTTVVQDVRLAGLTLVETLLAQIRNQPTTHTMLPTRLVVRHSSGVAG